MLIAYVAPRDRDAPRNSFRSSRPSNVARTWKRCSCSATMRALRERIEAFIAAGASKFVIVPLVAPPSWTDELGRLRDNVVRPVEGTR